MVMLQDFRVMCVVYGCMEEKKKGIPWWRLQFFFMNGSSPLCVFEFIFFLVRLLFFVGTFFFTCSSSSGMVFRIVFIFPSVYENER